MTTPDEIYLDHAAATPVHRSVLAAMLPYMTDDFYNPSSPYDPAVRVRRAYELAKSDIAQCVGAKGDEIIMTAGATESIGLAFGAVDGHIVVPRVEHQAVLAAATGRSHTLVDCDLYGRVSPQAIRAALRSDTQLVSVSLANSEIGTVQAVADIAALVREERTRRLRGGNSTPIYFHSDASQGATLLDTHVSRLGVDMLTLNAAKMYGPKQVGLLWAASHVSVRPLLVGGGQERGLRGGTENVAGVIGFARAMQLAVKHRASEVRRLGELRDSMQHQLCEAFPDAIVSGHPRHRLASMLHIAFEGCDAERLIFLLERQGILVASGSACAANKGTRSHVLAAIGLTDAQADGSLRISLGRLSTQQHVSIAAQSIIETVRNEYARVAR